MSKKTLASFLAFLYLAGTAQAQQWTTGPKFQLGLSRRVTGPVFTLGNTQLFPGISRDAEYHAGWFVRRDADRWYAQADAMIEIAHADSRFPFSTMASAGLERLYYGGFRTGSLRLSPAVQIGYKPLPWLRLYGGLAYVRNNWDFNNLDQNIAELQQKVDAGQATEQERGLLQGWRVEQAFNQSLLPWNLEGRLGVGADIGGLMVDLTYERTLTPVVNGITFNETRQPGKYHYYTWSLGLAYRLFPAKKFLLQSRVNKPAYEEINQKISFHRNEWLLMWGNIRGLVSTVGSGRVGVPSTFVETRYTRFLTRRFGLSAGGAVMRQTETNSFVPQVFNSYALYVEPRYLPVYSRRHRVGVAFGASLARTEYSNFGNRPTNTPSPIPTISLSADRLQTETRIGYQITADYQFNATDRLPVGLWVRHANNPAFAIYTAVGLSGGYRF